MRYEGEDGASGGITQLSRELADSLIGLAFILRKNGRNDVADELDRLLIRIAGLDPAEVYPYEQGWFDGYGQGRVDQAGGLPIDRRAAREPPRPRCGACGGWPGRRYTDGSAVG